MELPEQVMRQACEELKIEVPQIVATDRWRWTLDMPNQAYYRNLLALERKLQEKTGRPIDLRLETESDKNKRKQRNILSEPKQSGS